MIDRLSMMPGDPLYSVRRRSRLLGPDGKPLEPPTLLDCAQERSPDDRLLPVVEVLAQRNLRYEPWQARISPILDAKGRPYLKVIK